MDMTRQIKHKIIGFKVLDAEQGKGAGAPPDSRVQDSPKSDSENVVQMHEKVIRPEVLAGSTYKIRTPLSDHACYVTINDFLLNPGTPYEVRRPFEIFINSKNMDHYQWIAGLTLIISAVFRKGGDVTFMVDELKSVFDPKGGYFKNKRYIPSLVAEIGEAIESHLKMIGMLVTPERDRNQQALIDEKRMRYEQAYESQARAGSGGAGNNAFPEGATLCEKCNCLAMVMMDGCMTCLNCADSKCG